MTGSSGELAPVDLDAAFETFHEVYAPRIAGRVNDYDVKIAKVEGEYVWHSHPETDELFLVVEGTLVIQLRDGGREQHLTLGPGQLYVVPKGVEHRPVAEGDVSVVLVEPEDTVNTGDAGGPLTAVPEDLTAS